MPLIRCLRQPLASEGRFVICQRRLARGSSRRQPIELPPRGQSLGKPAHRKVRGTLGHQLLQQDGGVGHITVEYGVGRQICFAPGGRRVVRPRLEDSDRLRAPADRQLPKRAQQRRVAASSRPDADRRAKLGSATLSVTCGCRVRGGDNRKITLSGRRRK